MAYDDKKLGEIFPTRTGEATGTANERKMLDVVGGADGFRTRIQTDNGLTTMLRTKGGMPRFYSTNESSASESVQQVQTAYLETGELTWTFPGLENPTRLSPATWHLNDVSPAGNWMGAVKIDTNLGAQKTSQPTPIDTHVLRDGIDSLAIGFPRSIDPSTDADNAAQYSDATVQKKIVCSLFPPEMFSGKLRLFMQSQYGAKENRTPFDYSIEALGESALLHYQPKSIDGAPSIQFYFWPHATTGLYSAPNYTYYLLQIIGSNTPGSMDITGMPILLSAAGKSIRKALIAGTITGENIKKAEAYMFAEATIDTKNPFYIGTFNPGSVGNAATTLAWGWKFNSSGNEISIVRVGTVGDIASHTLDGRSRESRVTLTRTATYDGIEAGKWIVSSTSSSEYNWLDGWGSFNIFVPDSETSSILSNYSHKITWGTVAEYDYSNVPVYGYYDKDDAWQTVRLSKQVWTGGTFWEQKQTGLIINPDAMPYATWPTYPPIPWKEAGVRKSTDAASVEVREVHSFERMTINVGGWSYVGIRKGGLADIYSVTPTGPGDLLIVPSGSGWGDWLYGPNFSFVSAPQSFSDMAAALAAAPLGYVSPDSRSGYSVERVPVLSRHTTSTFDEFNRWTLVIPSGDCDAVHVATYDYRFDSNVSSWTYDALSWGEQIDHVWFFDQTSVEGMHVESFTHPWCWVAFMYETPGTWTINHNPPTFEKVTEVNAWSRSLIASPGTPSGSYSTLFDVDREFPYFNGAIRFKESAQGHYHGTEGYNSGGVLKNSLFVGWY